MTRDIELIIGESYTLTDKLTVSNPLCSEKLKPGDQVSYLGEFNGFPMVALIKDGKQTNMMGSVTVNWLTKLSDDVINKAVELMRIYIDDGVVTDKYLINEVHTKQGYKFVRLAMHVLDNYTARQGG